MRIRKRLSGRLPTQLPSIKYCFSTGWLKKPAPANDDINTRSADASRYCRLVGGGGLQEQMHCERDGDDDDVGGGIRQVSRECKIQQQQQQHHPSIGGVEEAIGEEPRTPPPCYGEKPALPRHKELLLPQQQPSPAAKKKKKRKKDEVKCSAVECSCGKVATTTTQKKKQRQDSVKGEESSQRKRVRVQQHQQQQQQPPPPPPHCSKHPLPPRDTAESSIQRSSSHDYCGPPPQRLETNNRNGGAFGAEKKSVSYEQEISKMDPLLKAMHTVVSEAGIEGLTAREATERILSRGLLSEGDIPRSVKMAKAMRDSPFLVEVNKISRKFVLWTTFLEESSKDLASQCGGGDVGGGDQQRQQQQQPCSRKRRKQRVVTTSIDNSNNNKNNIVRPRSFQEDVIFSTQQRQAEIAVSRCLNQQVMMSEAVAAATTAAATTATATRRILLDLNLEPQEDWA